MNVRAVNPVLLASLLGLYCMVSAQEMALEYHGAGWVQFGKIENSYVGTDHNNDYNGNWMQNAGSQINLSAKVDSNWEGALALGVVGVHLARGGISEVDHWYPFWVPYVGEARISYSHPVFTQGKFRLTLGYFSYDYSPDAKNLGLYLMRGYVYPGALESGFGSVFGGMAHYEQGGFSNDLILKSEDEKPVYDWSLADVMSYQIRPGLELGAGVNFYRLISQNSDLTSPGVNCGGNHDGQCYILDYNHMTTDSAGVQTPDTVTGSLAGTKVMARVHLDTKTFFGFSTLGDLPLGKQDLIFYGEAAIIGLKEYPVFYDDIWRRAPVMLGFNFPAFGYLDYLSLEVEYYASKNSSNNVEAAFSGAWVPWLNDPDLQNYAARDDWKWSVNLAKTLFGHMQFTAQVSDDHLRPGGSHDIPWVGKEALRTPKDWYWTCKLAYFF